MTVISDLVTQADDYCHQNPDTIEALRAFLVQVYAKGTCWERKNRIDVGAYTLPRPLVVAALRELGPTTFTALGYVLLTEAVGETGVSKKMRGTIRTAYYLIKGRYMDVTTQKRVARMMKLPYTNQTKVAVKRPLPKNKPSEPENVMRLTLPKNQVAERRRQVITDFVGRKAEIKFSDVADALSEQGLSTFENGAVSAILRSLGFQRMKRGNERVWIRSTPGNSPIQETAVNKTPVNTNAKTSTTVTLKGALDTVRDILNQEINDAAKSSDWTRVRDLGAFGERFDTFANEAPVR